MATKPKSFGGNSVYKDYLEVLRHVSLFKGMEDDGISGLLNCIKPHIYRFSKNEIIVSAGEKLKGVGVLLSGRADITKELSTGNRIILSKIAKGDIFAEVAAFSDREITVATVIASADSEVMFLPPERITQNCEKLCAAHNMIIGNLLTLLANKALVLNKKIEYLVIKSIRGKLCAYLLNMYRNTQKQELNIPFNRNELADYLGVSRPSMSRELGRMKEDGLIDYSGRKIILTDLSGIKGYAEK